MTKTERKKKNIKPEPPTEPLTNEYVEQLVGEIKTRIDGLEAIIDFLIYQLREARQK